jgi:hypothetical protein
VVIEPFFGEDHVTGQRVTSEVRTEEAVGVMKALVALTQFAPDPVRAVHLHVEPLRVRTGESTRVRVTLDVDSMAVVEIVIDLIGQEWQGLRRGRSGEQDGPRNVSVSG